MKRMFTLEEMFSDPNFRVELEEDVEAEARKFGQVDAVKVFTTNLEGAVSVRSKEETAAAARVPRPCADGGSEVQLEALMWDGVTNYAKAGAAEESAAEEAARLEAFGEALEADDDAPGERDASPARRRRVAPRARLVLIRVIVYASSSTWRHDASECGEIIARETTSRYSCRDTRRVRGSNGGDDAVEDHLRRSGHDDTIIALAPFDLEGTARELHRALSVRASLEDRRHHRGAGARAARQRGARAALPHVHLDVIPSHNLHKLGVCLGGENRVGFERGADGGEVELVDLDASLVALALSTEGDAVGVAHAHGGDEPSLAVHLHWGTDRRTVLGDGKRARHIRRVQHGLTHVHSHLPVRANLGLDEAGEGADFVRLGSAPSTSATKWRGIDAVAAHPGSVPSLLYMRME